MKALIGGLWDWQDLPCATLFPSCLAAEQLLTGPQKGHYDGPHWRPLGLAGPALCHHVPILSD